MRYSVCNVVHNVVEKSHKCWITRHNSTSCFLCWLRHMLTGSVGSRWETYILYWMKRCGEATLSFCQRCVTTSFTWINSWGWLHILYISGRFSSLLIFVNNLLYVSQWQHWQLVAFTELLLHDAAYSCGEECCQSCWHWRENLPFM